MHKIQKTYAKALAAYETARKAAIAECRENLKKYQDLTGNEPESVVNQVLDELDYAEQAADKKYNVDELKALLTEAENLLICWGREEVKKAESYPFTSAEDLEMLDGLFNKALAGHFKARPKVVELTFHLQA